MARGRCSAATRRRGLLRSLIPIIRMSVGGPMVGRRIDDGFARAAGGCALMTAFSFAAIWIGVPMGTMLPSVEAVRGVGFAAIFTITFIASTFVPVGTPPCVLRRGGRVEPGEHDGRVAAPVLRQPERRVRLGSAAVPDHPIACTAPWIFAIVAVCAPLAIRGCQRTVAD